MRRFLLRTIFFLCAAFSTSAYAAVGDLVATLSVPGQSNVVYTITNNPGGYFAIQNGNQVVEAVNTPPGNYSIGIQAAALGSSITQQFTLNYIPSGPPPYVPGFSLNVNLSGMENQYPQLTSLAEMQYYVTRGFKGFRLPIGWSQSNPIYGTVGIQPTLNGPLDTTSGYLNYAPFGVNVLVNSQAFASAPWVAGFGGSPTFANNVAAAPDGSITASSITDVSANSNVYSVTQGFSVGTSSNVASVYVKAGAQSWAYIQVNANSNSNNGAIFFNLSGAGSVGSIQGLGGTNPIISGAIQQLSNGWYRISAISSGSFSSSADIYYGPTAQDNNRTYTGTGTVALYLWGAQVNPGSTLEAYQPTVGGYLGAVDLLVANANSLGAKALLDIHTFGNGPGGYPIGSTQVPCSAFANLWQQISAQFMGNPGVLGYGLMNEPVNGFNSATLQTCYQLAINAIRANGDTTPIYLDGVNYSGAWNWVTGQGNAYNNANLYQLTDPLNKRVFEPHSYLDNDSSGSNFSWALEIAKPGASPPGTPTSATIGITRLDPVIAWASSHNVQISQGETGGSNDALTAGGNDNYAAWNTALGNEIALARTNNYPVYIWGAGAGFGPTYPAYLGPSSTSSPNNSDFSSAGLQSTLMAMLEQYTGYAGAQPLAYRVDLPVTITSTSNPEAPIVASVPYATNGSPTGNFAIRYNGVISSGGCVVTPHDYLSDGTTAAAGSFTPSTVTLAAGQNAIGYFTYTPSQAATIKIAATNNCGWTNPPVLGLSSINDVYRSTSIATPSNIYGMYRRFTPYIGPALTLARYSDNAQMTFSYNNLGNLPRAAIQTWAGANLAYVVNIYDMSPNGNTITCTGSTLPNLNLNNSAGYPEIEVSSGTHCNFNTPINGQTALSVIARMNQSSSTGGGLFRMDQFTGPLIWYANAVQIYNTGYIGSTELYGGGSVAEVNLDITSNAYHEYGISYVSGVANGLKSYADGSLYAQVSNSTSQTSAFTANQTGTSLVASNVTGIINNGDTVDVTGIGNETIVSGGPGAAGSYVTNVSGTASGASSSGSGTNYVLNAAFGSQVVNLNYFQFGSQYFVGSWTNLEFEQAQTLTLSQIDAINSADQTYYSTPLPDTLPTVAPTIIGAGPTNLYLLNGTSTPLLGVTVLDTNSGTPTDSVTITLTGASATLSGTGLSGSGPYTMSAASPATITSQLQGLTLTSSASLNSTITLALAITSSAGPTANNSASVVTIANYGVTTPYAAPSGTFTPVNKFGVNVAGGELYPNPQYPKTWNIDYYASKGFGLIRMPVQSGGITTPIALGLAPFDPTLLAQIKAVIDYAFTKNVYVVIDPHDYGVAESPYVAGQQIAIGLAPGGTDSFCDWWSRMASAFKNYPNVIFGLMNEPSAAGVSASMWQVAAAQAIKAIRATGATQLITIPGVGYTNAGGWISNGNGAAWAGFNGDSANNFIFEMHQYLDAGNSGTSPVATQNGSTVLSAATTWLTTNGFKAYLGEFGMAPDPWYPINTGANINNYDPTHSITLTTNSLTANGNMLSYMQSNSGQWVSWSAWSAGTEFPTPPATGGYAFQTDPTYTGSGYTVPIVDQPQMSVLQTYN